VFSTEFYLNGRALESVSPHQRHLFGGEGVFETLVFSNGMPRFWDSHWRRLKRGCERLRLALPEQDILLREFNSAAQSRQCMMKLMLLRSTSSSPQDAAVERLLWCSALPAVPALPWRLQVCRQTLVDDPQLAGIKHVNRLPYQLGQSELKDNVDEGLMLNSHAEVIEGLRTNVFFRLGQTWHTPELSRQGVAGVMREQISKILPTLGYQLELGRYTLQTLLQADEVLVCNAIRGVVPVAQIDDRVFAEHSHSLQIRDTITR